MGIRTNRIGASQITGSLYGTASNATLFDGTASYVFATAESVQGAFINTGSATSEQFITGSLTVSGALHVSGTLTADELIVTVVSSSHELITGSTVFGDEITDTHQFTGSVLITGSINYNGFALGTYSREIHTSWDSGNDTNGDGTLLKPFKTIQKAIDTAQAGGGDIIVVHRGIYAESPTLTKPNISIVGAQTGNGALIWVSGSFTTNTTVGSTRISNMQFNNFVQAGTKDVYFYNCIVNTSFSKTGTGYLAVTDSDFGASSGISITGAGTVNFNGGSQYPITVNNAGAIVYVKNSFGCVQPTITQGTFAAVDSVIYGAVSGSPALTATGNSTNVNLYNTQIATTAGVPERIAVNGPLSYENITFNKANSTLTNTGSFGTPKVRAYFQELDGEFLGSVATASYALTASYIGVGPRGVVSNNTVTIPGKLVFGGAISGSSGNYSMAQGNATFAPGPGSHAEGYSTTAVGYYQHVEGMWNYIESGSIWQVGQGSSAVDRRNLIAAYTGSATTNGKVTITGSLDITGSITSSGGLMGTASWAINTVNGGGGASVTISGSIPSTSSVSGSLWWNETDGNLYIQAQDPTGSTWVPAMNTVAGGAGGATITETFTAVTESIIQHNLNTTSPIIQVYSAGKVFIPQDIEIVDANTAKLVFNDQTTGTAVLSTGITNENISFADSASVAVTAQTASYALTTPQLDYLFFEGTSAQTVAQGNTLNLWDNVGGYNQGQVTYNTNGQFTLKAGKKYELESDYYATNWSSPTGGYLWIGWRIVSGTGTILTKDSTVVPSTHTTDRSSTSATKAFITTNTDVVVHVTVNLAAGTADIQGSRSFVSIKEIK